MTTAIPDQFEFKDILIDLNASYASNLKYYMEYKYSVADGTGGNVIDIVLVSCDIETAEAGVETRSSGAASWTIERLTVKTKLTVSVRVRTNGRVTEEEIVTWGEYTGNLQSLSTGQISISLALEGNILLLDRFLDKVFGRGSETEISPVNDTRRSDM